MSTWVCLQVIMHIHVTLKVSPWQTISVKSDFHLSVESNYKIMLVRYCTTAPTGTFFTNPQYRQNRVQFALKHFLNNLYEVIFVWLYTSPNILISIFKNIYLCEDTATQIIVLRAWALVCVFPRSESAALHCDWLVWFSYKETMSCIQRAFASWSESFWKCWPNFSK